MKSIKNKLDCPPSLPNFHPPLHQKKPSFCVLENVKNALFIYFAFASPPFPPENLSYPCLPPPFHPTILIIPANQAIKNTQKRMPGQCNFLLFPRPIR